MIHIACDNDITVKLDEHQELVLKNCLDMLAQSRPNANIYEIKKEAVKYCNGCANRLDYGTGSYCVRE